MSDNNIVLHLSPRYEGKLLLRSNIIHKGLQSISQHLGNNFVNETAQTNETKMIHTFGVQNLRNQGHISLSPPSTSSHH